MLQVGSMWYNKNVFILTLVTKKFAAVI